MSRAIFSEAASQTASMPLLRSDASSLDDFITPPALSGCLVFIVRPALFLSVCFFFARLWLITAEAMLSGHPPSVRY